MEAVEMPAGVFEDLESLRAITNGIKHRDAIVNGTHGRTLKSISLVGRWGGAAAEVQRPSATLRESSYTRDVLYSPY